MNDYILLFISIGLFGIWYIPKIWSIIQIRKYFLERGYTEEMIKFIMKAF
jgi:hypothetical protein